MPLGEFKKIYHMMFLKGPYINHNVTIYVSVLIV